MRTRLLAALPLALVTACSASGGTDAGPSGAPALLFLTTPLAAGTRCGLGGTQVAMGRDDDRDGNLHDAEIDSTQFFCNGAPGPSGAATLVSVIAEPAGPNCASGGLLVRSGSDDDRDGALGAQEVVSRQYVCSGTPGAEGAATLVGMVAEPAGGNCEAGGFLVTSGVDDDRDGLLALSEVDSTGFVCNGAVGPSGAVSLVRMVPEAAGANCAAGGVHLQSGVDDDRDGQLDAEEVDASEFACSGSSGDPGAVSLVRVTPVAAGSPCAAGGVLVQSGLDSDRDGTLAVTEVETAQYVCNGVAGQAGAPAAASLLRVVPEAPGPNCAAGGVQIQAGLDGDGDGALDPSEVSSAQYVCHAAGSTRPTVAPIPLVLLDGRANAAGEIQAGDVALLDGHRADLYSLALPSEAVLGARSVGPDPEAIEIHLFTAGCLGIPDPSDWGACYVGAASAFPRLGAGTYLLLVRGATGFLWSSTPYEVDVRLLDLPPGAAGTPDPGFGADGIACAAIGASYAGARRVHVEPDSTLRLVGEGAFDDPRPYPGVTPIARLRRDGSLDATYGVNGVALPTRLLAWTNAYAFSPDGAVVVGGASADDSGALQLTLLRVGADGNPDPAFGVDGWVASRVDGAVYGSVTAIDFDGAGNLLVAGSWADGSNEQMLVARFLPDGRPDPSFDGDGIASAIIGTGYFGTGAAYAKAIALQPDGRIVVAGYLLQSTGPGSLMTAVAVRYLPDGSLDPSFHGDGVVRAGRGYLAAARFEPDGGLVFAGLDEDYSAPPASVAVIARFRADGTPEPGFGVDGRVTTSLAPGFPPSDASGVGSFVQGVTLTPGGDALFVGGRYGSSGMDAVLSRVSATGELDPAFGRDGQVVVPDAAGWDVAVAPGGELVVALEFQSPAAPSLCALRLR